MAVYTQISYTQLEQFFSHFDLGTLISFEGITDGIDNSNYFVTTSTGNFVVTLFESFTTGKITPFLNLLSYLDRQHIRCPNPLSNRKSEKITLLSDKPAAVFNRLTGIAVKIPTVEHCRAIGSQLSRFHLCTLNHDFSIQNDRDLDWCKISFLDIKNHLTSSESLLIKEELQFQTENLPHNLPKGVIHGDLFKDNVLFENDKVSGLLDFYDAGTDNLLLDIAITVNDWCVENDKINQDKVTALLIAYESLRPLQAIEKKYWLTLLRFAALRFWLSRLHHQVFPRHGELTQQKNPLVFKQILLQHRHQFNLTDNDQLL